MIECEPTDNAPVEIVAIPEALSAPVPSEVAPSRKLTLPVGVPPPLCATVAVKEMDWPATAGLVDDMTAVLVAIARVAGAAN